MRAVRAVVGVVGELLITAGVLVLLFVVWEIGWQGYVEGRAQQDRVAALERSFDTAPPAPPATPTAGPTPAPASDLPTGDAFAILRIPRLGPDFAKPILEGVSLDVLHRGLGRYPHSVMPGAVGNFAVAGHRSGSGNPLADIDQVKDGDALIVETRSDFYVYRVYRHTIVAPSDVDVLLPVPGRPGAAPDAAYFTLTTCHPRWGNSQRWIVFSRLERTIPRASGLPADLLAVS